MKLLKLLPIICLLFISLSWIKEDEVYKYKFSYEVPLIDTISNKLFLLNDSQDVYVRDNVILIEQFIAGLGEKSNDGFFEYYFFNKLDSTASKYSTRVHKDSLSYIGKSNVLDILKRHFMYDFSIIDHTNSTNYKLIKKSDIKNKNQYMEHYSLRKFIDKTYPDSIVVTYNNDLKNYPFTLGKKLEDNTGLKVEKLHFFFKEYKDIKFAPYREFIFSIKKVDHSDEQAINNLFNRFMQDNRIN